MKSIDSKPEIVRRVLPEIDHKQLTVDLEKLKNKTIDMGAAEAAILRDEDIVFNPDLLKRINTDRSFPSIHWPLVYPKDDIEEAIRAYQWAIFFRMHINKDFPDYGAGPIPDENHRLSYKEVYEISTAIESAGFYMGYHLSLGLASGNCRSVFCSDEKRCWPMIKGKVCVRPNMGRPSMEAAGVDAVAMAKNLKWKLEENSKCFLLAGLVLIV
jgi:predicted metal-binding protein